MKRGTVTVGSVGWEYHGDTTEAATFYITPQPSWVMNDGLPAVQIVEYETSDHFNGSGYCVIEVELVVPIGVQQAVKADIATRFGVKDPYLPAIPVQSGTLVNLTLPDGEGGVTGLQVGGTDFGSDNAIFQVPLTAAQMTTVKSTLDQQGSGPFEVQYNIIVPAQMPAVTAQLTFDATTAFDYQVKAHEHTHWASSSSWTYDVTEQLTQSAASKVVVDKVDPNLPQSVVDAVAAWGERVITDLVSKEVAAALALQEKAGGHESFSVSEISSFSETYEQKETILWRLCPQATLPTFADLGLSVDQRKSLEVTVDKRKFVAQVTPQCLFGTSKEKAATLGAQPVNPFMSNIKPLKRLDVTVSYPTLSSSGTRTHTFTDNTPYTWEADWDDTAQGEYSLQYMAVYDDDTQVTGSLADIDATTYTLGLADIGTLNVVFDASQFFVAEDKIVDKVTVDFSFNVPQQVPFLQSAVLTPSEATTVFSSVFSAPITTDYVYTVTYTFAKDVKANPYTTDAKSQNGPWVRLLSPDATQSFNVFVAMEQGDLEVTEADINFYYGNPPYFPDIPASKALPRPTQSSPIQLKFAAEGQEAVPPAKKTRMKTFELFANTAVTPVTVDATLLLSDFTQRQVGPYQFTPSTVTLFAFSPYLQTFFLTADPTIVQWQGGELTGVKVLVTAVTYTPEGQSTRVTVQADSPNQVIARQPDGRAYPVFFKVANMPYGFADLEFSWTAAYVYKSGALYAHGTQQGTVLDLPAIATEKTPTGGKVF
ncbi:hypothetical protein AB0I28_00090 [Phytomonospora sp. NPDC050363]|uniref:hypothetical protein n=1 Tax=Phytomonospora sp. NPDC050363 TaxID=3155642 RepID=UPI0033C5C004